MYHPREVAARLGIAAPTLRVWSNQLAPFLGRAAVPSASSNHRHRRYTERDLYILGQAQALLKQRLSYDEVRRRLTVRTADAAGDALTTEMALLLEAVRAKLPALPRKQRAVAGALLDGPERFAFSHLGELARQLNISATTVTATVRGLGFSGFEACSAAVRRAYLAHLGLEPPRPPRPASGAAALQSTFRRQQENLEVARRSLAEADLDGICAALLAARRVIVCSTSVSMGTLLARLLRSFGLALELVDPSTPELAITLHDLRPEDVLLCLSLHAFEAPAVTALRVAARVGATRVVISDTRAGGVRRYANHFIFAPSQGEPPLAHSVLGQAAIIEALASLLRQRRGQPVERALQTVAQLYTEQGWAGFAMRHD